MAVVNLNPGAVFNVNGGAIAGNAHVYRTGNGYAGAGNVGWVPNGAAADVRALAVGHTTTYAINGAAGMIANGCPSQVQVLYDNGAALRSAPVRENAAAKLLGNAGKSTPSVKPRGAKMRSAQAKAVAGGSPAEDAMSKLTAQWYNAVVAGCHLDPSTFQLVQGAAPVGSTSETLWNMLDVVPPLSVSNYYNPSQANVFSTDYGAVIANLVPQNSASFQNDMGDYYAAWQTYLATNPTLPQGGLLALFNNWAQLHLPPELAQQCYTDYQQVSQGAIPVAMQMWMNAGGGSGGRKAYNATIDQLKSQLASAPAAGFTMDGSNESADVSHTWASVEAGGIFDFFEGGASGSYDELTVKLAQSGLMITANFDHLLTFSAGPLASPSSDPILSQYQPWYSSAALNLAYQTNNNTVWKHTAPSWEDTFGENGNLKRTSSALVVVDGITIVTTSDESYSSEEQTTIKSAAEAGFWPFFESEGSGGSTHDVSFAADGSMTITTTSPAGNPAILGVIVTPINGVLLL